jgi:hypothetical protein
LSIDSIVRVGLADTTDRVLSVSGPVVLDGVLILDISAVNAADHFVGRPIIIVSFSNSNSSRFQAVSVVDSQDRGLCAEPEYQSNRLIITFGAVCDINVASLRSNLAAVMGFAALAYLLRTWHYGGFP